MENLQILITGGSHGIGLAIAKELSGQGHKIFIASRFKESLKKTKEEIKNLVGDFAGDLSDPAQVELLYTAAASEKFLPNVLVLSAAEFGHTAHSVIVPTTKELQHLLDINVVANYAIVKKFLPILQRKSYARIILIGSTASSRKDKGSLYSISKWALRSYAYALRDELKENNIGVTLINPGGTLTEWRNSNTTANTKRLLESSDIAKLAAGILNLSSQAVVEEIMIRPMLGDTY